MDDRQAEREQRVTPLELFFDLVVVFAITQVTSFLSHNPTWGGLLRGLLLLGALWWAWAAYAWLTNTLDPEEGAVRLAVLAVVAAMLVVSLAAPGAFGSDAVTFGVAYFVVRAPADGRGHRPVRVRPEDDARRRGRFARERSSARPCRRGRHVPARARRVALADRWWPRAGPTGRDRRLAWTASRREGGASPHRPRPRCCRLRVPHRLRGPPAPRGARLDPQPARRVHHGRGLSYRTEPPEGPPSSRKEMSWRSSRSSRQPKGPLTCSPEMSGSTSSQKRPIRAVFAGDGSFLGSTGNAFAYR